MTTVTVHHLEKSRSTRVLWLLEELGVEYEIKEYKRNPRTLRGPPELRAVHPLGKSPVVEVDGVVLAESGAIMELLLLQLGGGRLRPEPGTEAFRRYLFFLHFAEGSMMTPLLVALLTAQVRKAKVPFFVKPIARSIAEKIDENYTNRELDRLLPFLEDELRDRPFFAGDELTAADVQMSYPLESAVARAGLDQRFPNLQAHLARTRARDAYQRAVARGGPMLPVKAQ